MSSNRPKLKKTAIGLVTLSGLFWMLAACCDTPNSAVIPATAVSVTAGSVVPQGQIQAEQLVASLQGWVLTEQGLFWTNTIGKSWANITPPGLGLYRIRGVYFRDASHGLILESGQTDPTSQATPLELLRTENGGKSWTISRLAAPDPAYTDSYSGPASFDFADALHGWVMVKLASSSNFSRGDLFRTSDGGQTWAKLALPIGEPVHFISPTTGWLAGGPDGSQFFVTHDGGENWSPQSVQIPAEFEGAAPQYDQPTFWDAQNGGLVVTFAGENHSGIGFYTNQDGGNSWQVKTAVPVSKEIAVGTKAVARLLSHDHWLYNLPGDLQLHLTTQAGQTWQTLTPSALSAENNRFVEKLDFANEQAGWLLASTTSCASFKSDCHAHTQLLTTSDGGQSWSKIAG